MRGLIYQADALMIMMVSVPAEFREEARAHWHECKNALYMADMCHREVDVSKPETVSQLAEAVDAYHACLARFEAWVERVESGHELRANRGSSSILRGEGDPGPEGEPLDSSVAPSSPAESDQG